MFSRDLPKYPSVYTIDFGLSDLDNTTTGYVQTVGVSEIFLHPNYTYTFELNDWSIALLKLSKPVVISDYVKTVCVPTANMTSFLTPGTLTTITGWGQTEKGKEIRLA